MKKNNILVLSASALTGLFIIGVLLSFPSVKTLSPVVSARAEPRIFELRTYTTNKGKLNALHTRFRNHTMRLFEKHGMTNIGYWTPQESPLSKNTLIYIVSHRDRKSAKQSWESFINDPDWEKVAAESNAQGRIVESVDSIFIEATDYSQIQ